MSQNHSKPKNIFSKLSIKQQQKKKKKKEKRKLRKYEILGDAQFCKGKL